MTMLELLATVGIIIAAGALLALFTRLYQQGRPVQLRPLPGYDRLQTQVGYAFESGRPLHLTLGQAGLHTLHSPASIAGLAVLNRLARDSGDSDTPPLVTVGEGTLLPTAQGALQHHLAQTRDRTLRVGDVQFVAHETDNFAYAAGVANAIQQNQAISNVMVGHFGGELAIISAAAERQQIEQIIGTDDPTGLAVATAVTDNLLIGEEQLAAPAYMEATSSQIASLQTQDLLRLLAIAAILGLAVYQLLVGG